MPQLRQWCKHSFTGILAIVLVTLFGSAAHADEKIILGFGDSLMAGYGLPPGQSFPSLLEQYLQKERGLSVRVINAGVSGDTSTGGRARLDWALSGLDGRKPDLVILELGANDALRGIAPKLTRKSLDAILAELKTRDIAVLFAGMLAPPNMGPDYEARFNAIYPDLADKHDVVFYPFFLDGVAADPELNQSDGIHPTAEGVKIIVKKIAPYVEKALSIGQD